MKPAIGYALLGVSGFGEFCLEHYRDLQGLRLVAVWNRTPAKAAQLASRYGLRHHPTVEELVSDPEVDLVHVATIPSLHAHHAWAALDRGKHVLCEKPLATCVEDAEGLLALADERGVRLGINFVMRFSPLWVPVRTLVQERLLGAPLRAEVVNCAGDAGLPEGHWFWDESQSGGIFVEHGVHFFDLLASWFGAGGTVTGADRGRRPGTALVEQVSCNVRYDDQTSAGFYHGFHQLACLDRQQVRLIFERGELVLSGWVAGSLQGRAALDGGSLQRIQALFPGAHLTREGETSGRLRGRGRDVPVEAVVQFSWSDGRDGQTLYGSALRDLLADLLEGVRNPGHALRVGAPEGLAALRQASSARERSQRTDV